MITKIFVKDLDPETQTYLTTFAVGAMEIRAAANGKNYGQLTLADKTGTIAAKVWENGQAVAEKLAGVAVGGVVKVQGHVELYNDAPQFIIAKLRPATEDEYDRADFVPTTPRDIFKMGEAFEAAIEKLSDPLKALLNAVYTVDFSDAHNEAPASVDYAYPYRGGVLEMTVDALALAEALITVRPELDADLLRAGVLLAGVGRVRAFTAGLSISETEEGELVGHIALALETVCAALATLPEFPADVATKIKHLLLAQNARYEWGSPRYPKLPEAGALAGILYTLVTVFKCAAK